jgi:hypothetical protein
MIEHRRGRVVAARVVGQPEEAIGVDGVGSVRLEGIRTHLVGEADPATLLAEVKDGAEPVTRDLGLGGFELVLAVAFQRPEDLAGDAFGVNANGHVCLAGQCAHAKGHVLVGQAGIGFARMITKYLHFEVAVAGRKRRSGKHPELRPDLPDGTCISLS